MKPLLVILIIGLILRILLNTAADSFDFYAFVMWAKYLTVHRFADVFEFLPDGYTPYPPLYYYVLMVLGHFISFLGVWSNKWLTYLIIRTPVFLADILVTILVYWFSKKNLSEKHANLAAAFYFLHPTIIYNTSVWGQIDAVVTVLGLMTVLALTVKRYIWGIAIYTLAVLTKLQVLALLPVVVLMSYISIPFKKLVVTLSILAACAVLPFLPIILAKGLPWTWSYFFTIPNWYAYTSVYAFNLWAPFGFIVSDNTKLFGLIQFKYLGIGLFWLVAFLVLFPLRKKKLRTPLTLMFVAFLLWLDFAFFSTRIHSRYLLYSFGFFAPFFGKYPLIGVLLSILMIGNLLLPLKTPFLLPIITTLNNPTVVIFGVLFAFMIFLLSFRAYTQLLKSHAKIS